MSIGNGQGKRIVIATYGSFGDIHPYIPLAAELKSRGHTPVIATSEIFRRKVEANGVGFHPLRPDLTKFERSGDADAASTPDGREARLSAEFVFENLLMPNLRESFEDLRDVARGADLLVTSMLTYAGPVVAELLKVPWVSTVLTPLQFYSCYDPPAPPGRPGLVRLLRRSPRLTRRLLRMIKNRHRAHVEPIYRLRAEVGLPPGEHPLFEGQHSRSLVLGLFSSVLAAPQPDWPENTRITGFSFHDEEVEDAAGLPPELAQFLDEGAPPIIFTLGSSAVWHPGKFYEHAIAAARSLGQRAVLLVGDRKGVLPQALPPGILALDYVPYGKLFSRASAVVHQGGIGTTGQALRAGKPMLVVPHYSNDQPDNATRIARLGVGRYIPLRRLTPQTLSKELAPLLTEGQYRTRASAVAATVRGEAGARGAADAIEQLLSSHPGRKDAPGVV